MHGTKGIAESSRAHGSLDRVVSPATLGCKIKFHDG